MSGKNCFRVRWSETPTYSGGAIAHLWLPDAASTSSAPPPSLLAVAVPCGAVLNVLDATTGALLARNEPTLEDDLLLHLDACTVLPDAATKALPAGSYVACSTRALQLTVLRLVPSALAATRGGSQRLTERGGPPSSSSPTLPYTAQVVRSWTAAQHAIGCLRFSPRGDSLASGSTDGSVKVWGVHQHYLTHNFRCPGGGLITCLAFDEAHGVLLVGTFEGHLTLFDLEKKAQIASGRPHTSAIDAAVFFSGGEVATIARDRKLAQYPPRSVEEVRATVITEHPMCAVFYRAAAHSAATEKNRTAAGGPEAVLYVGSEVGTLATYFIAGPGAAVTSGPKLAVSDTPRAAACTTGAEHEAGDAAENERALSALTLAPHANGGATLLTADGAQVITVAAIAPGSFVATRTRSLVANLDQVLDVKLLPLPAVAAKAEPTEQEGEGDDAPSTPPSVSFRRIVVTNSVVARLYPDVGCVSDGVLAGHTDVVMCCAVSPCGDYVLTGAKDRTLRLWDLTTSDLRCVAVCEGHTAEVSAAACTVAVGGDHGVFWAVSASADSSLRLWDVQAGRRHARSADASATALTLKPTSTFEACHEGQALCVAWAPNNQLVASGGKDKTVALWTIDGAAGKKRALQRAASLRGHRRAVNAVAFSPADRVLASASNDGTIRLWAISSYACARVLSTDKAALLQVAFFNAGQQLVSCGGDGLVRVWAAGTGECVATVEAHTEKVWALAVGEKGSETVFVTGSADGCLACTEDFTAEQAQNLLATHHATVQAEQALMNALRAEEFANAFAIALRLNHPRHLRQCVAQWKTAAPETIQVDMARLIAGLEEKHLLRLLEHTRDYVTNARHCAVAAVIVRSFLSSASLSSLTAKAEIEEALEGLYSYFQRHAARQTESLQQLQYIDWVTRSAQSDQAARFGFSAVGPAARKAAGLLGGADASPLFAVVEDAVPASSEGAAAANSAGVPAEQSDGAAATADSSHRDPRQRPRKSVRLEGSDGSAALHQGEVLPSQPVGAGVAVGIPTNGERKRKGRS